MELRIDESYPIRTYLTSAFCKYYKYHGFTTGDSGKLHHFHGMEDVRYIEDSGLYKWVVGYEANESKPKEVRSVSSTGGEKGVKLARFDLIPPRAHRLLAEHYGRGAEKYDDNNWRKGYEWGKSVAALERHLNAFKDNEDYDEETGSLHLVAVAWHAFTLIESYFDYPEFDDRWKGTKNDTGATE